METVLLVSLSLGQDWSRFPMERRGRYGLGAALVSSRSLALLHQQCDCAEKRRWPNLVSGSHILLWWQTELEKRVRNTQKGEVLHFRGCCGEGKQKSNAIAFSSKMKAIQYSWIVTGKNPIIIKDYACWKPTEMPSRAEWYQNNHWSVQTDLSYKTSYPSTCSSSQGQWGGAAWALLNYWVRRKHMENLRMGKQHKMSL